MDSYVPGGCPQECSPGDDCCTDGYFWDPEGTCCDGDSGICDASHNCVPCGANEICQGGECISTCVCSGGSCCSDGCHWDAAGTCCDGDSGICDASHNCDPCPENEICQGGVCVSDCECSGGECCSDGCHWDSEGTCCDGDSGICDASHACDPCPENEICQSGECVPDCVCSGGECCSDGCFWDLVGTCCDGDSGMCNASHDCDPCPNGQFCHEGACSDPVPPTTDISPDGSAWTSSDVGFTLTCTGGTADCESSYYKVVSDGDACTAGGVSAGGSGTVTCHSGSVCMKRVCYFSGDVSGNNESVKTSNLFSIDKQAPQCTVGSLPEWTASESFSVSWSGDDWTGSGISSFDIQYRIYDGGTVAYVTNHCGDIEWCDWQSTSSASQTFGPGQPISVGDYSNHTIIFRARATDGSGNAGEWSPEVSTAIDTEAPEVNETYPTDMVAGDVMVVDATVSDEVGIESVTLTIGDEDVNPEEKHGETGDLQWTLVWEIAYSAYSGHSEFTLTLDDINGNTDVQTFDYSILDCIPGETKPCDPRDPLTDSLYDKGVCRHTGERTCGADSMWGDCVGGILPGDEGCNSLDDDCDGEVDEDLSAQPCGPVEMVTTGNSICRLGTKECTNGVWGACEGARYPEAQEICGNYVDEDCDGILDNGCSCDSGETQECGTSDIGICKMGQQICQNGQWGDCLNAVMPGNEECNRLDDDCDGEVDEGGVCDSGQPNGEEPFPWWILSLIGVIILVVLIILWYYFRRQGQELTWETLKDKWTA